MGGLVYDSIPLLELSFQSPIEFIQKFCDSTYLGQQYINREEEKEDVGVSPTTLR